MRSVVVIVGLLLGGCGRGEPAPSRPGGEAAGSVDAAGATRSVDPAATIPDTVSTAGEAASGEGPPAQQRGVDGRCEPTPKSGAPCREGDGYCVLSWGEPGGHSEALWCRGGRWVLEQEVNLPRGG
ncbi:hypothetical protein [Nannocystis bainbridge]|uniref:Lipoprotein n=1 Tax=Nannocystis bainbridge TaxID=2995303 RepID=A0ABT5DZT2_9BACT|nr:hypothetical protein [Nannocystis bainbridge]MDC0719137.1 hypothetical protein [Nannocystis bainbridge]